MRPVARLSLVALGLAAVVYGTASLTGGWTVAEPGNGADGRGVS